jgi:hypothetical protein
MGVSPTRPVRSSGRKRYQPAVGAAFDLDAVPTIEAKTPGLPGAPHRTVGGSRDRRCRGEWPDDRALLGAARRVGGCRRLGRGSDDPLFRRLQEA